MKITFLLPEFGSEPGGGKKIVYCYANVLASFGHQVTVVHPALLWPDPTFIQKAKALVRFVQRKLDQSYSPDCWFSTDPRVKIAWVYDLSAKNLPDGDALIATAWQTAEWSVNHPKAKGKKFYFIQGLETWAGNEQRVMDTWKMDFENIVIAGWLQEISSSLGQTSHYAPHGFNTEEFGQDKSPEERDNATAIMLYNETEIKGAKDGIQALKIAKEQEKDLKAILFGVPEKPADLPDWMEYHCQPSMPLLRQLYNRAAMVLAPSWFEGWGLVPCEAMQCGCALLATEIGGHLEFAKQNHTALLSPAKTPTALADNIRRFIQDRELRIRLANNGRQFIGQLTWERAGRRFEEILKG